MERPKVSILCVTHNRPAFMPWLWWNFTKQTLPGIELVLIDSSATSPAVFSTTGHHVRYHAVEENHVGRKYELALELARGESVMLWGDDDYHHPRELEHAYRRLVQNPAVAYVGWREGWYLDLETRLTARYQAPNKRPCASTALVRLEHARKGHFTKAVASDTEWFTQIEDAPYAVIEHTTPHVLWLVHGGNMTPGLKDLPWGNTVAHLGGFYSIDDTELDMLDQELARLRVRLGRSSKSHSV